MVWIFLVVAKCSLDTQGKRKKKVCIKVVLSPKRLSPPTHKRVDKKDREGLNTIMSESAHVAL